MAEQAPDDVGLVSLEFESLHKVARNCGKSISIEIAEGSEPMTFPAQVRRLMKHHPLLMALLPKLLCAVMAIAGRFVKRFLGLAKGRVRSRDEFPVKRLKPGPFHVAA